MTNPRNKLIIIRMHTGQKERTEEGQNAFREGGTHTRSRTCKKGTHWSTKNNTFRNHIQEATHTERQERIQSRERHVQRRGE